jgi:choline kinase
VRAIIVAAGRGRRLGPNTASIPKTMVHVGGKPMLTRQLEALAAIGLRDADVHVVRGYLAEVLTAAYPGLTYHDNPAWERNNILASLMYAASAFDDDVVFSYSDIVFAPEVTEALAAAPAADAQLIVDRRWADTYVGRDQHPVSEAELTGVTDGRVTRVGKRAVPPEQAAGEFIGLARFSAEAMRRMHEEWQRLAAEGLDRPFGLAPRLEVAYLTDMLNHLIEQGADMRPVYIDGRWREIDTEQDLARAEEALR